MDADKVLDQWIEQYGDRLLRIAYSYIHHLATAEDCLQESFIKAYRKMEQLNSQDNPFPWLVRIVINECKAWTRRKRELTLSELPEQTVEGPEKVMIEKVTQESIHQAIMDLPEKYRTPVILHYFHDLQLEVIAEILGEKSGTVRTRISRAKGKLKKILGKLKEGEPDESRGSVARS